MDVYSSENYEEECSEYEYLVENKETGEQFTRKTFESAELLFDKLSDRGVNVSLSKNNNGLLSLVAEFPGTPK